MGNETIFSCVLCGTPVSDDEFTNNAGLCDACMKKFNEETKDLVQEYVDDEIIISDIPLFNQEECH